MKQKYRYLKIVKIFYLGSVLILWLFTGSGRVYVQCQVRSRFGLSLGRYVKKLRDFKILNVLSIAFLINIIRRFEALSIKR